MKGAKSPLRVQSTRIFKLFRKFKNTHSVAKRLFRHAEISSAGSTLLIYCLSLFAELAAHEDAHDGGHHQAPGPAAGVAQAVEALDVGVEILVHLHPVGVELQLGGVEQGFVGGEARTTWSMAWMKLMMLIMARVGHGGGDITGHGVHQGGLQVGLGQLLGPGALAVQDIAEALDRIWPLASILVSSPTFWA